ncbi:hypothetical protein B7463_g7236, partial [Scytalidium lignicola]
MGVVNRLERQHSNSPPPQQQISKRDKRRTMLSERLADITAQFSSNRDAHFREQLQAIQLDMNLIMSADVHDKLPLPDSGDEIYELIQKNMPRAMMKSSGLPPRAGKLYAEFAREVNDAIEERDSALTTHLRDYEVRLSEFNAADAYRRKLAEKEHQALSNTLRDRLINSVTSKKARLGKDKESLEIGEGNALLLHPSQFGITNPASPGGFHTKRATRHRRDADELLGSAEANKRKRKAAESDESPAPARQRIDNGSTTPLWLADKQMNLAQQVDSSLYSIDKLFTDKELAMTYNAAALAAHSYMTHHKPYSGDNDSLHNEKSGSSSDNEKINGHDEDEDQTPGATSMERQYSHATRSTRGGGGGGQSNYNTGIGIDAISELNYPGNMQALTKQMPKLPPLLSSVMQKQWVRTDLANGPQGLADSEAAMELEIIKRARSYNDDRGLGKNLELENGGKSLLEIVAPQRGHYKYFIKSDHGKDLLSNLREELGDNLGRDSSASVQ